MGQWSRCGEGRAETATGWAEECRNKLLSTPHWEPPRNRKAGIPRRAMVSLRAGVSFPQTPRVDCNDFLNLTHQDKVTKRDRDI